MTSGVTKKWVAQQQARAACPVIEGWRDGVLTVFVKGRPRNPMNGSHGHWDKHRRWAKEWRQRTATSLLRIPIKPTEFLTTLFPSPSTPKRIAFTVYGPARFDDDNLRAVCKPVRDALKDMAIIDDDRPSAGHVFEYVQAKPTRTPGAIHGIAITVRLA